MRKVLHILGYFTEEDIAWITHVGVKKDVSANDSLIRRKTDLKSIFFVLKGRFDILRGDGQLVAKVKSGEILGEMSFVEDEFPNVDVVPTEDSSVINIDHEYINDRFLEVPSFETRFYKAISHFLSSRLRGLTSKSVDKERGSIDLKELDANIDKATLERINIAGERFNRLVSHFS